MIGGDAVQCGHIRKSPGIAALSSTNDYHDIYR